MTPSILSIVSTVISIGAAVSAVVLSGAETKALATENRMLLKEIDRQMQEIRREAHAVTSLHGERIAKLESCK